MSRGCTLLHVLESREQLHPNYHLTLPSMHLRSSLCHTIGISALPPPDQRTVCSSVARAARRSVIGPAAIGPIIDLTHACAFIDLQYSTLPSLLFLGSWVCARFFPVRKYYVDGYQTSPYNTTFLVAASLQHRQGHACIFSKKQGHACE